MNRISNVNIPSREELATMVTNDINNSYFPPIGGSIYECLICRCQLSSKQSLKHHILSHVSYNEKEELLSAFETCLENPRKVKCKACTKEIPYQYASKHLKSCQGKPSSLLNKRISADDDSSDPYSRIKEEILEENHATGSEGLSSLEKIQKKFKKEGKVSLNGRGPKSLASLLIHAAKIRFQLKENTITRQFKLETREIVEPFDRNYTEMTKLVEMLSQELQSVLKDYELVVQELKYEQQKNEMTNEQLDNYKRKLEEKEKEIERKTKEINDLKNKNQKLEADMNRCMDILQKSETLLQEFKIKQEEI